MRRNHDKYALNKLLLKFRNRDTEKIYTETVTDTTINFARTAWLTVILFGGAFGFLDSRFFGASAPIIITARASLIGLAVLIIALTWWHPVRRLLVFAPTLFILSVGTFCILQTALSPPDAFSPYIMGVFLAFCGTFCTVGIGFLYTVFALLISFIIFELFLGVFFPVNTAIFIVYNFFFVCFILAFAFLGYYTEIISRKRFIVTAQLKDSLKKINTLSGLLPICASCKQIRDDKGYWNQIESYLSQHSAMEFSHGICPECAKTLYPELVADIKTNTDK